MGGTNLNRITVTLILVDALNAYDNPINFKFVHNYEDFDGEKGEIFKIRE